MRMENTGFIGMTLIKKEQYCEMLERTKRFAEMVAEVDKAQLVDFADGHNHPFYYMKSVAQLIGELAGDAIGISEWWCFKHHEADGVSYKVSTLYLHSEERDTYVAYELTTAGDVWDFIQNVEALYTEEEIREALEK